MKNLIVSLLLLLASVDVIEDGVALLEYLDKDGKVMHVHINVESSPCKLSEGTKVFLNKQTKKIIQCK